MGSGTAAQPSALLASFRDSYRDLLRYLSHRTGSADEARDVAHDTWLRLADMDLRGERPALCDGEARAYVFAMARNLVIDRQRHAGVVTRHAQAQASGATASCLDHGPDACEALMYRQAVDALEAALATVPDRARQVFVRHRVNGEDQGALAAEYGISRNMVERDMMLAMDRVQVAMEQWHAGCGVLQGVSGPRRKGRRRALSALLGACGLAVGGTGGWLWWRAAMPSWQQQLVSAPGPAQRHVLPDGSAVILDAQSRVQVAYGAAQRGVRLLEGAAFFEVTADAVRLFEVDVPLDPSARGAQPGVRVTVLGTRFGVERAADGAVDVQVESGRVRVQVLDAQGQAGPPHELVPAEAASFYPGDPARAPLAMRLRTPQEAAGWRHGLLAFDDAPLGETLERLRRYLPHPVEVESAAAALRLSGQVRTAQAEDFVRALPASVAVRVQWAGGRWRIRKV